MAQITVYSTDEMEVALQKIKLYFLEKGIKTNKVQQINEGVIMCAKFLTGLDQNTMDNVL